MKTIAATLALTAMLASVPAQAKDRREPDRKHRHHHRDKDDDGVGAFIAGAVIAGGLVALLGKKKKAEPVVETGTVEPVAFERVVVAPADADPDAATAACVASAEREGRRGFPIAQVDRVTTVAPDGQGFRIAGDLLLRANWRETGERRGFSCTVDAEAVRAVRVEGLEVAAVLP
jgi:hypothetical protein